MIVIITFLHVLVSASLLSALSYFIWNEMDENGILEWWRNFRDYYYPIKDGKLSFMGAVTGQCPTCMNMWLTGLIWLSLVYFITPLVPDVSGVYRALLVVPVMLASNVVMQMYLKWL